MFDWLARDPEFLANLLINWRSHEKTLRWQLGVGYNRRRFAATFSEFGTVASAVVITDRESGRSRGFGFVELEDGADQAIEALNGQEHNGRPLRVNEAQSKGGGGGGGRRGGGDRPF